MASTISNCSLNSISLISDVKSSRHESVLVTAAALSPGSNEQVSDKYSTLLRHCGSSKNLSEGRRVHVEIIEAGLDRERYLGNLLVQMYGKCGSLEDARSVFDGMLRRNLFSWTLLMSAYAQNGYHREALDLFWKMDRDPDNVAFITALCACSSSGSLAEGRAIHYMVRCSKFARDTVVNNSLISMYGRCQSLSDARSVFDSMEQLRNIVSWNAMIAAYAQNGQSLEAVEMYWSLNLEGLSPDYVTFVSVLGACSSLAEGQAIHRRVYDSGLEKHRSLPNALVTMYGRFGSLSDARGLFEALEIRDVSSWNAVIHACAVNGDWRAALEFHSKMGVKSDSTTYINLLSAFTAPELLEEARKIHREIINLALESDLVVSTALISMYGKCGSPAEARQVFDRMKKRDMVSWNVMIGSYIQNSMHAEALELYQKLDVEGFKRTKATFVSILGACANLKALDQGRLVHRHVSERGLENEVSVATALVSMYARCGSIGEAREVFRNMKNRDAIAWSTLITALANNGFGKEALGLYSDMVAQDLRPDSVTFTSLLGACSTYKDTSWVHSQIVKSGYEQDKMVATTLLNSYGKHGRVDDAQSVFEKLRVKDTICWNAMITCYVQNGCELAAMELFRRMNDAGMRPDAVTFITVLEGCSSLGRLSELRGIHSQISSSEFESNVIVTNTLINMYAKCGSLEDAELLFSKAKVKTIVSWTAMLSAYSQFGYYSRALDLFQEMDLEGVKPDEVTYSSILFVCTHGGSLEQGWKYFMAMIEDHCLTPNSDHYVALVDLMGRSGKLQDAKQLLESMPFEPDSVAWMSFLTACRIHEKLELAEAAAEQVYEIDPSSTAPYIALSNMYAALKKWDKVAEIRKAMEDRGLKKLPGLSFIEVNNRLHEFTSGDRFHPQRGEIVLELERLNEAMKMSGYVPDTNLVLHDVSEEEKERMLLLHSERMAIAYGLISSRGESGAIRVVKNLRVCSDCHAATKLISRITKREIIVRDCHRFHRFTSDGKCSCGDYW